MAGSYFVRYRDGGRRIFVRITGVNIEREFFCESWVLVEKKVFRVVYSSDKRVTLTLVGSSWGVGVRGILGFFV